LSKVIIVINPASAVIGLKTVICIIVLEILKSIPNMFPAAAANEPGCVIVFHTEAK